MLEEFREIIPSDEFTARWNAHLLPSRLDDLISDAEKVHANYL